ncbi:hypothetical protein ACFQH6_18700 [Halobacteriaceae archaeon GCM10025711]
MPQLEVWWWFIVPAHASRISEEIDEGVAVTEAVFEAMGEFVVPMEVEAVMRSYSEDEPMKGWFDRDSHYEPVESETTAISASDELSFEAFRNGIDEVAVPGGRVRYLREWSLTRSRAWMFVDGADQYVSRETPDIYKVWSRTDEEVLDVPMRHDPIGIRVLHTKPRPETDAASMYKISVTTAVDTWFEETAVGERLSSFLWRLYDGLDVAEVEYDSNTYDVERFPSLWIPGE